MDTDDTDKNSTSKLRSNLRTVSPQTNQQHWEEEPESGRESGSSESICVPLLGVALAALALGGCMAMTSLQLRHWRNSVTLLARAVQVEPANFLARVMLGNALFERRQFDSALCASMRPLCACGPTTPEARLRAGVALTELGRPADAMPYLLAASQLAPAWPETQRRLGLALLRQGQTKEAREAYQKLVPLMPATAEGRRDLADMLAEGQQFAEAVRYYCEALRLKPDFDAALNNLAMLRACCTTPPSATAAKRCNWPRPPAV